MPVGPLVAAAAAPPTLPLSRDGPTPRAIARSAVLTSAKEPWSLCMPPAAAGAGGGAVGGAAPRAGAAADAAVPSTASPGAGGWRGGRAGPGPLAPAAAAAAVPSARTSDGCGRPSTVPGQPAGSTGDIAAELTRESSKSLPSSLAPHSSGRAPTPPPGPSPDRSPRAWSPADSTRRMPPPPPPPPRARRGAPAGAVAAPATGGVRCGAAPAEGEGEGVLPAVIPRPAAAPPPSGPAVRSSCTSWAAVADSIRKR
jgi:hypothetical protein